MAKDLEELSALLQRLHVRSWRIDARGDTFALVDLAGHGIASIASGPDANDFIKLIDILRQMEPSSVTVSDEVGRRIIEFLEWWRNVLRAVAPESTDSRENELADLLNSFAESIAAQKPKLDTLADICDFLRYEPIVLLTSDQEIELLNGVANLVERLPARPDIDKAASHFDSSFKETFNLDPLIELLQVVEVADCKIISNEDWGAAKTEFEKVQAEIGDIHPTLLVLLAKFFDR